MNTSLALQQLVKRHGPTKARRLVADALKKKANGNGGSYEGTHREIMDLRSQIADLKSTVSHSNIAAGAQRVGPGDVLGNISRSIYQRDERQSGKGGIISSEVVEIDANDVQSVYDVNFSTRDMKRLTGTDICYWQVIGLTDEREAAQLRFRMEVLGVDTFAGVSDVPMNVALASLFNPNSVVEIRDRNGKVGVHLASDTELTGQIRVQQGFEPEEDLRLIIQLTSC